MNGIVCVMLLSFFFRDYTCTAWPRINGEKPGVGADVLEVSSIEVVK